MVVIRTAAGLDNVLQDVITASDVSEKVMDRLYAQDHSLIVECGTLVRTS